MTDQFETDEATAQHLQTGTILDGKYEILSYIGCGGMGSIYKARHSELGNLVAIKIVHGRFAANPEAVKRFQNEARFIASLRHKNILTVYSFGSIDGLVYMAMEFVKGRSLSDRLYDVGPFTPAEALPIFLQVCDAMIAAHKVDVLHRDLKPANVMLVEESDGTVCAKVVDFGLAKLLDGGEGQRLTQTGEVVGDPHYMSPEQAQGGKLDARADVYSFGCLMYELLTGEPPFTADSPVAVLYKQISEHPQPFAQRRKLPAALEAITFTCMSKSAAQRYDSFATLQAVLSEFLQNPNLKVTAPAGGRGSGRRLMLVTASLAMLAIAAAVGLRLIDETSPAADGTPRDSNSGDDPAAGKPPDVPVKPVRMTEERAMAIIETGKRTNDPLTIAKGKAKLVEGLHGAGKYERALQAGENALQDPALTDQQRADVQILVADTYSRLGQSQKALELFEQTLATAPFPEQRDAAARPLISWYINRKDWASAERLTKGIDLSWIARNRQLNGNYIYQIAVVCHRGKPNEAERLKEKMLAAPLDDLGKTCVLYNFVTAFSAGGDLSRALDCLQEMRGLVRSSHHPQVERMDIQRQIAEMALLYHAEKYDQVIWNGRTLWEKLTSEPVPNREQLQQAGQIYASALRRTGKDKEEQAILKQLQTIYRF
ncbi:MAG: serine/threonine-protein kinase [Candidatus Obscuribacterales bacterium]